LIHSIVVKGHCLVEQVRDYRNKDQQCYVQECYETGLDRQYGHVAGIDDPAGDQDQEDEEKLENIPVNITSSGSLVVGYY
jgi:hypothetical protein